MGNLVFAAGGGPLQRDIGDNAFFRQLAAFLRLGLVPAESHVWLCHVDVTARGLLRLAETPALANLTHHLEHSRRDAVADLLGSDGVMQACDFAAFLDGLERACDDPAPDPASEAALLETFETLDLYSGRAPQPRARRLEIASALTTALLARLGLLWPERLPENGRNRLLEAAQRFRPGGRE